MSKKTCNECNSKTKYHFCSEKCLKNGMIEECGYCHDKFPKSLFVIKVNANNIISYFCDPDCLFCYNKKLNENEN